MMIRDDQALWRDERTGATADFADAIHQADLVGIENVSRIHLQAMFF